jgi:hypothetical protein
MKPKSKTQSAPVAHDAKRQMPGRSNDARWFEWTCRMVLACCFALFARLSWRTWPDVLVDFGHELYIPWRICEGEVLYRDIPFTMGPLSQYFNALLFRIFGVSLGTLILANLAILAGITGMLYWLFRRIGTCGSATFAVFFFLAVFAFAQYSQIGNYNYVCPYRHEVTHGLALGLAGIICLVCAGRTPSVSPRWIAAAGVCLGLNFLTKAELFVPAAGVAAAFLLLMTRHNRAAAFRAALVLCGSAAIPVAVSCVALTFPLGTGGAIRATLGSWVYAVDPELTTRSGFYRVLGGWDRPVENIQQMLLAAVCVSAGSIVGVMLEMLFRDLLKGRVGRVVMAVAIGCGGVAAVFVFPELRAFVEGGMSQALPLVLSVVIVAALVGTVRRKDGPGGSVLLLTSIYSLALLAKIMLAAGMGHYGFVLAMPGILVFLHVAVSAVPEWLRRRNYAGTYFRALVLGLVWGVALLKAQHWIRIDAAKTMAFGSGGDLIYVDPRYDDRAAPTVQTLEFLQKAMQPGETLVAIPEGTTLNYLLRKRNPSGFLMFSPWEFDAHGGEQRFLKSMMETPPDYIVLVTMDMTIHGRGNFGSPEYGQRIYAWIDRNYQVVNGFSSTNAGGQPTFQSAVFKRKSP